MRHEETHRIEYLGWLRAAVLGTNDGIISTSSLLVGIAAAHASHSNMLLTGFAGLVAGSMSMATGEYVSVASQADTEKASIRQERAELASDPESELRELTAIYVQRGLEKDLARQVAVQLMAHDALGTHARDELGISETIQARPLQAALASASSFAVGAAMPLAITALTPGDLLIAVLVAATLVGLAGLGALAARTGGAPAVPAAIRVTCWSALAMGSTVAIGSAFDVGL
ncbi:VIT family protein [Massilia sp. NEAU-DD11]|uniref:VIT family protein n=1 Tax=Massilia cellulosiltytica TaxID=2683234 RepID=A0A7X3G0X7_9BURK|nr:VIT family protein [Telluria cellulosilytica]MVW61513.1 VIT family protein [Telluria cellulosilytica]